ncbi:MAG: IS4/IS5 family transposase, partial [Tetragenococcus koreensis]|nr:IS4/IS5 family transposase [Tetragenococcus koreensis]
MGKYKTILAFNKYFLPINFKKLPFSICEKVCARWIQRLFPPDLPLNSISHSQLSLVLAQMDDEILWAIFVQLLEKTRSKIPVTKRNALYLVDS